MAEITRRLSASPAFGRLAHRQKGPGLNVGSVTYSGAGWGPWTLWCHRNPKHSVGWGEGQREALGSPAPGR